MALPFLIQLFSLVENLDGSLVVGLDDRARRGIEAWDQFFLVIEGDVVVKWDEQMMRRLDFISISSKCIMSMVHAHARMQTRVLSLFLSFSLYGD